MGSRLLAILTEGIVACLDSESGSVLATYKGCVGAAVCFMQGSRKQHVQQTLGFAVLDAKRPFIHFYYRGKVSAPSYSFSLPEKMTSLAFSPCGVIAFCGGSSGNVYAWHMSSGCLLRCWRANFKAISELQVTPDGHFLIVSGLDGGLAAYNTATVVNPKGALAECSPEPSFQWAGHNHEIISINLMWLDSQLFLLATVSKDGTCCIWQSYNHHPVFVACLPEGVKPTAVAFNRTSLICYVGADDSAIYSIDLSPLKDSHLSRVKTSNQLVVPTELKKDTAFLGHTGSITDVVCSIDGLVLYSASDNDGIRVWDIVSRQTIRRIQNLHHTVKTLEHFIEGVAPSKASLDSVYVDDVPIAVPQAFLRAYDNTARPASIVCPSPKVLLKGKVREIAPEFADLVFSGEFSLKDDIDFFNRLENELATSISLEDIKGSQEVVRHENLELRSAVLDFISEAVKSAPPDYRMRAKSPATGSTAGADTVDSEYYESRLPSIPISPDECPLTNTLTKREQSSRIMAYLDRNFVSVSTADDSL